MPEPSERVVLPSVTGGSTQGIIVNRPSLVKEVFDISKILSDPKALSSENDRLEDSEKEPDETTPFLSLDFGKDPINMVRCADNGLSAHVPKQLKQKIWDNKYINIVLLLKSNAELADIFSGGLLHVADGKIFI